MLILFLYIHQCFSHNIHTLLVFRLPFIPSRVLLCPIIFGNLKYILYIYNIIKVLKVFSIYISIT